MRPYKDRAPETVTCPKCSQEVGTETIRGRLRTVTTTTIHVSAGRVCHAILKTAEQRRTLRLGEDR